MMDENQIKAFVKARIEAIRAALKEKPDSLENNIGAHDITDEVKDMIRSAFKKEDPKE